MNASTSEGQLNPMEPIPGFDPGDPIPVLSIHENGPLSIVEHPGVGGMQPILDLKDSVEIPPLGVGDDDEALDVQSCATQTIETSSGAIWVQGTAILCSCPSCQAPMTVRLWLMVADCWNCETSIELTPEQQRAVEELIRRQQERETQTVPARSPLPTISHIAESEPRDRPLFPSIDTEDPVEDTVSLPDSESRLTARLIRRAFNSMPAWLVSFILHVIALLILAMILLPQLTDRDSITISTFLSKDDSEGGEIRMENPEDQLQDDIPLAQQMTEGDEEARDVIEKAEQDAAELIDDPDPISPLPDINDVKKNITTRTGPDFSFAARDPRVRHEIVKSQGGTTLTEAAVSRGLRWLASVQNSDGSWSLRYYYRSENPRNPGDMAGTSLALLPFLGAGQTHENGVYKETVAKGLKWILEHQKENGDLRGQNSLRRNNLPDTYEMYAHGQATIVLVEAFAMTGDERFREPAQRAIKFIEDAQYRRGGWRYRPSTGARNERGDTSVFGWQLMALQSARGSNLGLKTDESTFELADQYLDIVSRKYDGEYRKFPAGSLYRYQAGSDEPKPTMTAEGLLCRFYLGWDRDKPAARAAVNYLVKYHPPSRDEANIYYWYYATQALHHYGGSKWKTWNEKMRDTLVLMQNRRGDHPGSWTPSDFEWGGQGGRIFVTAMAVCTLEVYYRHLPLFEQLKLDENE